MVGVIGGTSVGVTVSVTVSIGQLLPTQSGIIICGIFASSDLSVSSLVSILVLSVRSSDLFD